MKECIILEIIPTHSESSKGKIIQLQALKIKDLNIIDRFDYRLNEDKISNKDLVNLISYDKDYFKYVNDDKKILKEFSKWSKKLPLLILDNSYTNDYLSGLTTYVTNILENLWEEPKLIANLLIKANKVDVKNFLAPLICNNF